SVPTRRSSDLWQENQVFLSDISHEALEVAKLNGKEQGIEPTYLHGDLFEPFIERGIKLDILVSNPPYISQEERHLMSPSVLKYEPDRKSTRLNSSHVSISYAVFCL